MTESTPAAPFDRRRALFAGLAGVGTHLIALAVGYLAAQFTDSSEGLRDLGNAVLALLAAELVLGIACLVTGGLLFIRGKRDIGFGLQLGWLVGMVLVIIYTKLA